MSGDWSSDVCSSDLFPSHDKGEQGEQEQEAPEEQAEAVSDYHKRKQWVWDSN